MSPVIRMVPWSLVLLRLMLAPAMLLVARTNATGIWLAAMVLIALLTDIYDGVLARRWQCDTPAIRVADSLVDTVFYLAVLAVLWVRVPQALMRYWPLLALLLLLEGVRYVYDLRKFGRMASYHSYLAKTWGLVMAVSVIAVLGFGRFAWALAVSMLLGILNNVEGLAMSFILPVWRRDVKTLPAALALRRAEIPPAAILK